MAADLVGYANLASSNIHDAVSLLRATRRVLVDSLRDHNASSVKTAGDFVLAIFENPADLLFAACEAQMRLFAYHHHRSAFEAGHWKIGLALGEVHKIDGDLYGNAINIAARLQGFAGPGEIWFTEDVKRRSALPDYAVSTSQGTRQLKNIKGRIRMFRALIPNYAKVLSAAGPQFLAPENLDVSTRKPIVEIKPFRQSGEARSTLIAQALTDEVGLILSRLRGSITLVLDYGKAVPDYVLRGSVQSHGNRLRIAVQLVSAAEGDTIWAERFDGDIGASFDFQDHIARDIVSALQLVLTEGEQAQLWRRATTSGEAWEAFQKGHDLVRRYTRQDHWRAKDCYLRALSIDPDYLCAIVALGFCHLDELRLGWSPYPERSLEDAKTLSLRAQAIAARHPDVLALTAYVRFFDGDHAAARDLIEQAVAEAPQSSEIIGYQGALLDLMGDFEKAISCYKSAISKSLFSPAWIAANLALTLLAMEQNSEAEEVFNKVLLNHPDYARAWIGLTATYVRQGRVRDARDAAKTLLSLDPGFAIEDWAKSRPFSDGQILEAFKSDLALAGLPQAAAG
jgi:class 3 adenylate cyclase/Flp pilus assembly protein TadD